MISRRSFLRGLGAVIAAPAVIRTPGLLMPVRAIVVSDGVSLAAIAHPTTAIAVGDVLADEFIWWDDIAMVATRLTFDPRVPAGLKRLRIAGNTARDGETVFIKCTPAITGG